MHDATRQGYALEVAVDAALRRCAREAPTALGVGEGPTVLREAAIRRLLGPEVSTCDHAIIGRAGVVVVQDKWTHRVDLSHVKAFVMDAQVVAQCMQRPLVKAVFASRTPLSQHALTVLQEGGEGGQFCGVHPSPEEGALEDVHTLAARVMARLTEGGARPCLPPARRWGPAGRRVTFPAAAAFMDQFVYVPPPRSPPLEPDKG